MANIKRLTNEIIDQRIQGRPLKRLDDYMNNKSKINWKCLDENCGYIWITNSNSILSGRGCPKCSKNLKLSNEAVDTRLQGRKIKRMSDIVNSKNKTDFQCLNEDCNYIWRATPNSILGGNGCPKCAELLWLTNEKLDKFLENKNIKRINDVINTKTKNMFQCLNENCNHIWDAIPNLILRGSGCPKCAGVLKLTNEAVDEKLACRNIKRISDIINARTKIAFQCLIDGCGYIWYAIPNNILNLEHGCPNCKIRKNEKLVFSILIENNIIIEQQKMISLFYDDKYHKAYVDFYLPSYNTIIEYNGAQHYKPVVFGNKTKEKSEIDFVKQQKRDQCLEQYCKNNNIKLIIINGKNYFNSKLKKYVIDNVIPKLCYI